MKNLIILCSLAYIFNFSNALFAQDYASYETIPVNYKKRSAVYDYIENKISNTDTIPEFDIKEDKLKISGTIYHSDGVTPAKNVILHIYQPDEKGNYKMKRDAYRKRYVQHRGWIKTDENGRYTFYTFMPGKFLSLKELKQIHRVIKEPGKPEYEISSFFFNDDPLLADLSLAFRAQAVKSLLRLEKEGNMYIATKDIRLRDDSKNIQ